VPGARTAPADVLRALGFTLPAARPAGPAASDTKDAAPVDRAGDLEGPPDAHSPPPAPQPETGPMPPASAEVMPAASPVVHQPLLSPGRVQRLVWTALSRPRPSRVVDMPRCVRRWATHQPIAPVPWRPRWSLARGAHLLVDIGTGMQPFQADQADVVSIARRVVGRDLVVLNFRQVPTRPAGAGPGPVWTWPRYHWPARRAPVLLLTDLGLSRPLPDAVAAAPVEWTRFLRSLAARAVVAVVLLPYVPRRVPAALRRRAVLVHWDRATRVRQVRPELRRRLAGFG
jgi:hypothetical protein